MADLYINMNPDCKAGNADASQKLTTSGTKTTSSIVTTSVSGEIELFSTVAHLVHLGASPDADSTKAFFVFPSFPKRVKAGKGVYVSAKTA